MSRSNHIKKGEYRPNMTLRLVTCSKQGPHKPRGDKDSAVYRNFDFARWDNVRLIHVRGKNDMGGGGGGGVLSAPLKQP